MIIEDIRIVPFERPAPVERLNVKAASILNLLTESVAVEVRTSDGVTGESLSVGGGPGLAHYLEGSLKPLVLGRDLRDRERIWQDMWAADRLWFSPQHALGTLEIALWDAYGKTVGVAVSELLGRYRDKVPAYASSMTLGSVEEYVEAALGIKERGYFGYKLHITGDVRTDIEICERVREAVGPDWHLMVDAVSAYDYQEALKVGRVLEALDFTWYEEPLRDYDIGSYRKLREKLDVPLVGVEVLPGAHISAAEYIRQNAVDVVRSNAFFKGGISPMKKMCSTAESFGMRIEITAGANPLLAAANLHVAATARNNTFYEQLTPEPVYDFACTQWSGVGPDGYIEVPTEPGLGPRIDWDYVDKYRV